MTPFIPDFQFRFAETARQLGCDENEESFERKFEKRSFRHDVHLTRIMHQA
jgi:hypothetical protein